MPQRSARIDNRKRRVAREQRKWKGTARERPNERDKLRHCIVSRSRYIAVVIYIYTRSLCHSRLLYLRPLTLIAPLDVYCFFSSFLSSFSSHRFVPLQLLTDKERCFSLMKKYMFMKLRFVHIANKLFSIGAHMRPLKIHIQCYIFFAWIQSCKLPPTLAYLALVHPYANRCLLIRL